MTGVQTCALPICFPVTIYGANGVINGGQDIYVATVQGDLDFVKLEAWYLGHQENFTTYTLAATSNIDIAENAKIGLEARYVNLKLKQDAANDLYKSSIKITGSGPSALDAERDNDMFRLAVDGKFSIVNARLAYTKTGKEWKKFFTSSGMSFMSSRNVVPSFWLNSFRFILLI